MRVNEMKNGTWIQPEQCAYGSRGGTYGRRAKVVCPDGRLRIVRCTIADTFFSIPALLTMGGKIHRGFVYSEDNTLKLHIYPKET